MENKKFSLDEIKIGSIKMQEIKPSDFLGLFRIGKSANMCKYLNWGPFKYENEALYMINEIYLNENNDSIAYAIYVDNRFSGVLDFHTYNTFDNSIQIGYFLSEELWGRGIIYKCMKEAIKKAFYSFEVDKIKLSILKDNERSINLAKKLNFKYEESKLFLVSDDKEELGYVYSLYKIDYMED